MCTNQNGEMWATHTEIVPTASLMGFDIIVYAKVGDGLNFLVRYPASFYNTRLSERRLQIQNLKHYVEVVSIGSRKSTGEYTLG